LIKAFGGGTSMNQQMTFRLLLIFAVTVPLADAAGFEGFGLHFATSEDDSDLHVDIAEDTLLKSLSPSTVVPEEEMISSLNDDAASVESSNDVMKSSVEELIGNLMPEQKKPVKVPKLVEAKKPAPVVKPVKETAKHVVSSGELLLRLSEASLNHDQIGAKPKKVAQKKPKVKKVKVLAKPKMSKLDKVKATLFKPTMLLNSAASKSSKDAQQEDHSSDLFEMNNLMEKAMHQAAAHSHKVYKAKAEKKMSMEEQLNKELDAELHKGRRKKERMMQRKAQERRVKSAKIEEENAVFSVIHAAVLPTAKVHVLKQAIEAREAFEAKQLADEQAEAARKKLVAFEAERVAVRETLREKEVADRKAAEAVAEQHAIAVKRFAAQKAAAEQHRVAAKLAAKVRKDQRKDEVMAEMHDLKQAAATPAVHSSLAPKKVTVKAPATKAVTKAAKKVAQKPDPVAKAEAEAMSEIQSLKHAAGDASQ